MAQAPGSLSLDEFLATTRGSNAPCGYVRATTDEQRTLIREKYALGHHQWTAFARWLAANGNTVSSSSVQFHFSRGHDDDR